MNKDTHDWLELRGQHNLAAHTIALILNNALDAIECGKLDSAKNLIKWAKQDLIKRVAFTETF